MRALLLALLSFVTFPLIAQVQHETLANGLNVVVKEDHRAPVVVSMLYYRIGSADEPGGITGISHALEHLMFKGTKKFPLGKFSKIISSLGGEENAFTSYDYTAYYEKLPASHLAKALELEADRMENLQFHQAEFDKEMKVVREERRLRTDDNPHALTLERFNAAAHLASPYQHPIIGWMGDLLQMKLDDAKTWYEQYYAPNNATLVVVGDVNPTQVFNLARKYFRRIPAKPKPIVKAQLEPPYLGKKQIVVHAPAQVPMLMLGYSVPTLKTTTPKTASDPYVLELIAAILDMGDSGRFSKQLIRGKQVASSLLTSYNPYARYQTQFIVSGTASQGHPLTDLKTAILSEIQRLKDTPITEAELQRIKNQLSAQKVFEHDSSFSQAAELGVFETIGLGWQESDNYMKKINAVTPKEIQHVAQQYFTTKRLTEAELIPTSPNHRKNP